MVFIQFTSALVIVARGNADGTFRIAITSIPQVSQQLLVLSFRLDLPIYRRYNPRT
jgi:hypothetical protein